MRHQSGGVQPVRRQQRPYRHPSDRSPRLTFSRVERTTCRPAAPGEQGQGKRDAAQAAPRRDQAGAQQQWHQGARGSDAKADAGEDQARNQPSPPRIHMRQYRRRGKDHDHPAGQSSGKAPAEEPRDRQRRRAREEAGAGQQHHAAQHPGRCDVRRRPPGEQRTGEIAGQIGGAEIDHLRGREPGRFDQWRDERRVGEASQSNADQAGR